jgi:hypothetical protein
MGACLVAAIWLSGCGYMIVRSTVRSRFRADFGCDGEVEVTNAGGTSYEAYGCNQRATYTCVSSSTCVRESQAVAPRPSAIEQVEARVSKRAGHARTTRSYDEERKLHVVRAEFTAVRKPYEILLLGAPQAELTTVFVRFKVRGASSRALEKCERLDVLINDEPFEGEMPRFEKGTGAYSAEATARYPFEVFRPLGRQYATFGVRACGVECKLEGRQMDELTKFFEIFSQIAIDVQNEALPTRDADALSI